MPNIVSGDVPLLTANDFFLLNERVFIHLSTDYPDFVGVMHRHAFVEIVYILSGSAIHYVGKNNYEVSKGDLCIINFETPHAFITHKNSTDPFVAYDLIFMPDFFDNKLMLASSFESISSSYLFYSLFPEQQPFQPDLRLSGSGYSAIGEVFTKIYNEYRSREKGFIDLIRAYVIELIVKIFRLMDSSHASKNMNKHKMVVDSVLQYIRENFDSHITIDELANDVFFSKDYFAKLFRQITGTSVNTFLQKTRIDEACKLLCSTDYSVKEIAMRCGYVDMKSFYSMFKKNKNVTPGEYRKSLSL